MNLTIKDVPAGIHRKLKRRAEKNRRSLNGEVLSILEGSLQTHPRGASLGMSAAGESASHGPGINKDLLAEVRHMRSAFPGPRLTQEFLHEAKNWGRK